MTKYHTTLVRDGEDTSFIVMDGIVPLTPGQTISLKNNGLSPQYFKVIRTRLYIHTNTVISQVEDRATIEVTVEELK